MDQDINVVYSQFQRPVITKLQHRQDGTTFITVNGYELRYCVYHILDNPTNYLIHDPYNELLTGDYSLFVDDVRTPDVRTFIHLPIRIRSSADAVTFLNTVRVMPSKLYLDYFLDEFNEAKTIDEFLYHLRVNINSNHYEFRYKKANQLCISCTTLTKSEEGSNKILLILNSILAKEGFLVTNTLHKPPFREWRKIVQ